MLTSCGVFQQSTNVARRNWAKNFLNSITFIHCNWYEIWNVPSTAFWENCKVTHQMVHCEQFSCIVYDPLHDVQFNDLKTFNSLAITHSSADVLYRTFAALLSDWAIDCLNYWVVIGLEFLRRIMKCLPFSCIICNTINWLYRRGICESKDLQFGRQSFYCCPNRCHCRLHFRRKAANTVLMHPEIIGSTVFEWIVQR